MLYNILTNKEQRNYNMVHPLRNLDGEFIFARVRLEKAMKEKFDELAKADARTTTYFYNEAFAEYLEKHSDYERH